MKDTRLSSRDECYLTPYRIRITKEGEKNKTRQNFALEAYYLLPFISFIGLGKTNFQSLFLVYSVN